MARLAKGAERRISMAYLVMCAEKIRRLLYHIFYHYSVLVECWTWSGALLDGAHGDFWA